MIWLPAADQEEAGLFFRLRVLRKRIRFTG